MHLREINTNGWCLNTNEKVPIVYNLADIIKQNFCAWMDTWPEDSIARLYSERTTTPERGEGEWNIDFECLRNIVAEKTKNDKPRDDVLSIHVRLGDLMRPGVFADLIPRVNVYENQIKQAAEKHGIVKCDIYYGNHRQLFETESQQYIQQLKTIISKLGLEHELVSNSVDEDFCALATSKHYLPSIRGFSWLTGVINPNNVIWGIFTMSGMSWNINRKNGYTDEIKQDNAKYLEGIKYHHDFKHNI